ncbi:MAG: S1C family serine protease [Actinomycetota bacterium]|nr:S1C family serine protease [Actinomycetota bacterium]
MRVLEELHEAVRDLVGRLEGSVVAVGNRTARGSGIVVAAGRVLTNAHNIRGEEVKVVFADGRTATGKVSGTDIHGDLAVVAVETGKTQPVEWGDPASIGIGFPVFTAANPGGQGLRVTFGLVSAVERSFRGPGGGRISGAIEHTAPLLPGSSGGPLVDSGGRLLGVNTNRLGEGFYLAIPADTSLKESIDALARGQVPRHPRLGVGIAPPHVARALRRAVGLSDVTGLLVRHVQEGSPAAEAGLAEGDLIVDAGGKALGGVDDLYDVLEAAGPEVELKLLHGSEERRVTVRLNSGSDGASA